MYRYVIESRSPISLVHIEDESGPPVVPPVLPPPPSDPPPPADDSPFAWPPQPVGHDDPAQRYQALNEGAYAGAQEFQNPLPGSHRYAGDIQASVKIDAWNIQGWRLWARQDTPPQYIRRLLATGR